MCILILSSCIRSSLPSAPTFRFSVYYIILYTTNIYTPTPAILYSKVHKEATSRTSGQKGVNGWTGHSSWWRNNTTFISIRMIILVASLFLLKNSQQLISAHPRQMHFHLPETDRNNNVRASWFGRLRLKCDGTCAETIFRLSVKRTSPFKSAGVSVQSTTGSRGVRISGSNGGYTMFRGSVKGTGYPLHSPVSPSLPLPCVTVCHHISTGLYSEHGQHTNTDLLLCVFT
jgi:hypothetical protein